MEHFTDGDGKGSPRLKDSKELQKRNIQSWKCQLVDIHVSWSGDISKVINSFELKKTGREGWWLGLSSLILFGVIF